MSLMGIEPRTSGVGSNRSTNWANITAQDFESYWLFQRVIIILEGMHEAPAYAVLLKCVAGQSVSKLMCTSHYTYNTDRSPYSQQHC